MVAGIIAATQLIDLPQIFKSQASLAKSIAFVGPEVKKDEQGQLYTKSLKVELSLTSPYGYSQPFPTPPPLTPTHAPKPTTPPGRYCIQVVTKACAPDGSICKEFPTPCDVPAGWVQSQTRLPVPGGTCGNITCAKGSFCVQLGFQAMCINPTSTSSASSSANINNLVLNQVRQSQSSRTAAGGGVTIAVNPNLPVPNTPTISCGVNVNNNPVINVTTNTNINPSPEAGTPVVVVNNTLYNPGEEIPVRSGELNNVSVRNKNDQGYGAPSETRPIICNPPPKVTTIAYRLAENPYSLKYSSFIPFYSSSNTLFTSYVFQNITPGMKTVYVQFLSNSGKMSNPESADIRLDYKLPGGYCIQVVTKACAPDGSICKEFPTPCDVPAGWVPFSPVTLTPTPTPFMEILPSHTPEFIRQ